MVLVKNGWPWSEAWGGLPPSRITPALQWAGWIMADEMGGAEYDYHTLRRIEPQKTRER